MPLMQLLTSSGIGPPVLLGVAPCPSQTDIKNAID